MENRALRIAPVVAPRTSYMQASPVALVRVHGRRVSWSRSPTWSPSSQAFGPSYLRARDENLAGTDRELASTAVRRLLRQGADKVVIYGSGGRIVIVRKVGNDLRTAWSDDGAWNPGERAEGREYEAARQLGLAGVLYGAGPMDQVLATVR